MGIFKCLIISFSFASVLLAPDTTTASQSDSQSGRPDLRRALNRLEEGRATLEDSVLAEAQAQFEKCVTSDPKEERCRYQLARVAYYRALGAQLRGDKHQEQHWADVGIFHALETIRLNGGFAEARSLLADLYARKITGMISGSKFGPMITAENQRALVLNPKSAVVQAAVGREYLFKPKAFGGNVDKALEALRESVHLDPKSDESWTWLAVALRKKGEQPEADKAIAQALILNPRSAFSQRVRTGDLYSSR